MVISSFSRESLDPTLSDSGVMYDWLVWNSRDGALAPGLATSREMSPDGKVWAYKLRGSMRFHNSDPFTAEDVKFSLERTVRPEALSSQVANWRGMAPQVEGTMGKPLRGAKK